MLSCGADVRRKNKRGSTPARLAAVPTGRGGAGSPAAKAAQREIQQLLARHGA